MCHVDNSLSFLGTVLCPAVAGAALCEMGRHRDALEAHRAKRGCGARPGSLVPQSQKGRCWACEQDAATAWGWDALVAALLCEAGQTGVASPQLFI